MENNEEHTIYDFKDRNGGQGETFALFLRQPFAHRLSNGDYSIEIRSKYTPYRGDVLICSTIKYEYDGMQRGATIGLANLYDIKPVSELTEDEWKHTRVRIGKRKSFGKGYAWFFRNQRRIIEFPIHSKNKIAWIKFNRDDIFVYPNVIIVDKIKTL